MNHLTQRRTVNSPCCNKKIHIQFPYGALTFGAFCDCGRPFYLHFRMVRAHRQDYKGHRAGRLIKKSLSNNINDLRKRHRRKTKRPEKRYRKTRKKHV